MHAPHNFRRVDHASDLGRRTLIRRRPAPAGAAYLREMQGYVEEGGPALLRKEVPSGIVPLIIVLDHGFTLHDPATPAASRALPRSFIAGLREFLCAGRLARPRALPAGRPHAARGAALPRPRHG